MQVKLLPDNNLKIHFRTDTVQEANDIKNELQQMGYDVILFKIKEHRKVGTCSRVSE